MSEQPSAKKPRLAAAAEALIEAASLEVGSVTQKQLAQNLDSLKASFDSNLNKVVQTMKSSNENFDAKINTLNQHVASVKSEIGALKALLEKDFKRKILMDAMQLTHLVGEFQYRDEYGHPRESSDLAKKVLARFLCGSGANLPAKVCDNQKAFREKFVKQIKDLIQRDPRLRENTDGSYTIFYE